MGKAALMFLVMLALSAIAISGQGQTDQTAASATTTTTTTTGSTVGPTTTTTTTDMTLYEGGPSILPGVKAHIKITKNSDADLNGYIYKITIEDDPEQAGFTPKDIVATFSVDNNVYIKYDDMKIQYSLYDVTTKKRNYVDYKPNPCDEKGRDLVNALAGLTPQGIILNYYDIAKSGTELIGCLNDVYDWSADVSVDGNKIVKPEELQKEKLDKYKIINKIMGADEKERNNRHVETIVYSKDPKADQTVPPRSVVITIPVRPKDCTVNSDIKMWIDIRGYRSTGVEGQVDTPSQAQNIALSLVPCSLGIYFENQNMFQKESPKSTEEPMDAGAWFNKGFALHHQGLVNSINNSLYAQSKFDEAIKAYDEAIRLDPNNATFWINKGFALWEQCIWDQGKRDEAIKSYDEAIRLDPTNATIWYWKGRVLLEQMKYDECIKAFDEATRLDPKYAMAWYNKGVALVMQKEYDEAIKADEKVIELNPQYADAWAEIGFALNGQGKYNEAIKAYEKAIEIDPQNPNTWEEKGFALKALGRTNEALDAFTKTKEYGLSIDPALYANSPNVP